MWNRRGDPVNIMMKLKNKYFLVLLIAIVILGSCSSSTTNENSNDGTLQDFETLIQLVDLNGNEVRLENYKGKIVVLNFWATWCKPCISEMPSIDRLIKKLDGEEVVFLAASDENPDRIKRFVENNPHEFIYTHLQSNVYKLGISVLPTTYIINKEGVIAQKLIGAREWDSEESINLINGI